MTALASLPLVEVEDMSRRFNVSLREDLLAHATEADAEADQLEARARALREDAARARSAVKALSG